VSTLTLSQNFTACGAGANFIQFMAQGGTAPYIFEVLPNGAGGSINSSTGNYIAPNPPSSSPNGAYDVIQVTDNTTPIPQIATTSILVAYTVGLIGDIIQTQMGLANGRVYEWNQKLFAPIDYDLYVILTQQSCKPFGNVNSALASNGSQVQQFVSMYSVIDIDIISRGPAARDQKELIEIALNSVYSQQQQQAFAFNIGKLPISNGFINLSNIDGSAIPYRYKISHAIQYFIAQINSVPYYNTFINPPTVYTND
jgi:hypothetical protein